MFNRSLVFQRARPVLATMAALVLVTGCAKHDEKQAKDRIDQEVSWARAALERNPRLEVVATDTEARTFTVKHRGSGAVQVVSLDKLAAVPVGDLTGGFTAVPPVAHAAVPEPTPAAPPPAEAVAENPASSAPPAESNATSPAPGESGYTIQREGGQLRVSGPGVSIVSANAASSRTAAGADSTAADSPIVCEGGRFLHLDRRSIRVNGTAVIARNGCELHITNSTIDATGAAISAVDATVHIANSEISGQSASVEASGRAKLFVRGSTFHGISRRNDPAEINDQGGNTWR